MKTHIDKFTLIVISGDAWEGHSELYSLARQSQSLAVKTQEPAIPDGDIA